MSPTPWYIATNILAIAVYLFCALVVGFAAAAVVWTLLRLDRAIAPAARAVVETAPALRGLPEKLSAIEAISSELKELQAGDIKVLQQVGKTVSDLRMTVEEFEGILVSPPTKPRRRAPSSVDEEAEIAHEQRLKERSQRQQTSTTEELIEERGKFVGEV